MEITLKQYKNHLVDSYRYEIDNVPDRKEQRRQELDRKFGDQQLMKIIRDTYSFIKDVLKSDTLEDGYVEVPVESDTTSFISLNLTGGYHSDTLYTDSKGRTISSYIIRQFFGDYFYIDLIENEYEREAEDDVVSFDYDYHIYMQGFPKNIKKYKREINLIVNEPVNVIFIDFEGTLMSIHGRDDDFIEKRIATLSEICKEYDCKVVIEAAAKISIDEETMETDVDWINNILNLFAKYGIECIGRTPSVERKTGPHSSISMWKEDEIRLYLYRHPEIQHYCVLDDDDTKTIFHWETSDLDKVRDHLVTPLNIGDTPEEEGLLPSHKEAVGKALQKENEVRKLSLRSLKR